MKLKKPNQILCETAEKIHQLQSATNQISNVYVRPMRIHERGKKIAFNIYVQDQVADKWKT